MWPVTRTDVVLTACFILSVLVDRFGYSTASADMPNKIRCDSVLDDPVQAFQRSPCVRTALERREYVSEYRCGRVMACVMVTSSTYSIVSTVANNGHDSNPAMISFVFKLGQIVP
jgi:hypothetical protein